MTPNPPSPPPSGNPQQQNWGKVALFLVLLLVMAWVYESQPADTGPAGKQTPLPPAPTQNDAATRQRPPLDRDSPAAPRPVASQRSAPIENDADATHPARSNTPRNAGLTVRNARVTDEDGSVIYRGDVDLGPTLDRIDRGKRLRFSHDGIVFENRERRLPQKPSGYYHEFVHPTPGDDGPGGQRVVLGREDEVYYTPDHYHTFRRVQ